MSNETEIIVPAEDDEIIVEQVYTLRDRATTFFLNNKKKIAVVIGTVAAGTAVTIAAIKLNENSTEDETNPEL